MRSFEKTKRKTIAPRADILIESMRDIGYSLQTAIADIIDNSITAESRKIELLVNTHSDNPAIGILDDGTGMSNEELLDAMRLGSKNPLDGRSRDDLGRFGLGLKTASFSQCRHLTVLTRRDGRTSGAIWDLDSVARTNDWLVEVVSSTEGIPWADKLGESGTLVVWQKLDRLVGGGNEGDGQNFVRQIDETATHIELVFHRFLSGKAGVKKIQVLLNNRILEPFDPFHSWHPATILRAEEVFLLENQEIRIQSVTLPHHGKVSSEEWNRYAGPEGYVRNQGFYVYRGKRLIIHGTWFKLAKQTELTKLSRVRIDIPNDMDSDWKIDLKKSSARPPAPVRDRLRRIITEIGATSRRVYTSRGTRLIESNRLPVWRRFQDKNQISYSLDLEHPAFASFSEKLPEDQRKEFGKLLELASSTLPIDSLFSDVSSNPESVYAKTMGDETFAAIVRSTCLKLRAVDQTFEEIETMMSSAEPFRSQWQIASQILKDIQQKEINDG